MKLWLIGLIAAIGAVGYVLMIQAHWLWGILLVIAFLFAG